MQKSYLDGIPSQDGQYAGLGPVDLAVGGRSGALSIKQQSHKTDKKNVNQLDMHDPGTWPSRQSIPTIASRQNPLGFSPKPKTNLFMPGLPKSGNESPRPPP